MQFPDLKGRRIPQLGFRIRQDDRWASVSTDELFARQTVVVFALPGAFTPTCSSTHLPRYNELAGVFAANGVDRIVCLSVNDPFVMQAWAADQKADNIFFLPDGNAELTRALGMLVGKSELNFGMRSWRYSMLVRDGVIEQAFVEPDKPGDPFEVSDADTMLRYLNPVAALPQRVTVFSKPGCPHCARARRMLAERGLRYEEIVQGGGVSYSTLQAVSGRGTAPQIFIDGRHIGGADELAAWLDAARRGIDRAA